ncbi:MAG: aconitase X catalytic domain-containing protein [Anaerolineae bacterium]|nr:aconitase X catalytic domain-containing protein [Anaerolineae bacterium]
MHLTYEEQAWLDGEAGPAIRRAMEIVVALGAIYGAEQLIPVESVQISGVSFRNIGDAGLSFLRRWAEEGARVRVPTMLNPTAMDMCAWQDQGFDPAFAGKQKQVVAVFAQMGVGEGEPVPTCTPYLIGNRPSMGAHIAWAESSAVAFANSVLGARTNREGGPGAIAAAIVGRTGAYGLHLDANRRATLRVEVRVQPETVSDYSALGAWVGQYRAPSPEARNVVPYFANLALARADPLREEKLKALGAAMAATGAVALYHVAGVTAEARAGSALGPQMPTLVIDDFAPGYALLSDPVDAVDLVWIGCPHASLGEIARVADLVRGQTLRLPLWITCARPVRDLAAAKGLVATIEAAGGRVFADACMAIAPVRDLGFHAVATPSAKGAYYLRNLAKVAAVFGTVEACVTAAVEGKWR